MVLSANLRHGIGSKTVEMTITDQHLGLVSRIYDVVLDPGTWGDILVDIAKATGAKYSNLIVSDVTQSEVKIQGATYSDAVE
jgi:hypothetical protein